MLPTKVWVDGFKTYSPNHLIKALNLKAPHLVGLYLWFIDGVAAHKGKESEVEVWVAKYNCPSCGEYERERVELDAGLNHCPTCHKSPLEEKPDSPVWVSDRHRGAVLWGQQISYKDIGESVGKDWRTIQAQVQELAALGYIEAKRPNKFVPYSFYVADSCKYEEAFATYRLNTEKRQHPEEATAALDAQAAKAFADDAPDVEPAYSPSLSNARKAFAEVEEEPDESAPSASLTEEGRRRVFTEVDENDDPVTAPASGSAGLELLPFEMDEDE
jgi:hypothetical protein